MKYTNSKFCTLLTVFILFLSLQASVFANDEFLGDQRKDYNTVTEEDIKKERQEILSMADETLKRLYKEHPEAKEEIKNSYGYGIFEAQVVNVLLYVAGNARGVVYDNKTKTPVFMNAVKMGTGPGVGYKSFHGVLIFDNETVFDQLTTIGVQVSATGDAMIKLGDKGTQKSSSVSLVPGVAFYQMTDSGLVVQANWGTAKFTKDPDLNKK